MNEHMSPDFEERLHKAVKAPEADAAFVSGLRSILVAAFDAKPARRFSPRLAWGAAVALALLIGGSLLFSPQVVEAIGRLLGYIPGVGYVENGPALRVLAAPVTIQKEGVVFTLEKGAADAQRTVLLAQVQGYPNREAAAPTCEHAPQLVSSDGSVQRLTGVGSRSDEPNDPTVYMRFEFEAMPVGVLDAALEIPCLMFDASYPDWSIPLHFQVAQGTDQVIPVIEFPTSVPARSAATGAPGPAAESAPAGFAIVIKSAAELADGYALSGVYEWSDSRIDASDVSISHSAIVDANGQDVPYGEVDTNSFAEAGPQQIPFAYQITGKDFAWPLSIVVHSISVIQPGQGAFQFDAGADPQVGQTWNVDIDVAVGQHVIHVKTIQLKGGPAEPPDMLGYEFTMTSDTNVASAVVEDLHPVIHCDSGCGGGGGGGGGVDFGVSGFAVATGPFVNGWVAKGYSPAGLKTFAISDVSVFFKGPWQVTWQPSSP